jgi:outer membrane protein assembly factor BamE (lipoprotein component of BamABCDE complex)
MNEIAAYIISSFSGFAVFYIIRFKDYKVGNKPNILGWIAILCTILVLTFSFLGLRERNRKPQENTEQIQSVYATLTKTIYDSIVITGTTKADVIKILGNPIDTKIVNNVDIWLYLQKSREAHTGLFKRSLTLKFRPDNSVLDKSYAEHFGNENITNQEFVRQIKRGVSTQNDVKKLLGYPTRVKGRNGETEWHYEHFKKIYGSKSQGQWRDTRVIIFGGAELALPIADLFGCALICAPEQIRWSESLSGLQACGLSPLRLRSAPHSHPYHDR